MARFRGETGAVVILLSHATGNQNVRQAALALAESGLLEEFWTCLDWNPEGLFQRALPASWTAELDRRSFPKALARRLQTQPWREAARLASLRLRLTRLVFPETAPFSIDRVQSGLDRRVARRLPELPGLKAVYGYEDGSAASFARAAELGLLRIYELTTGYWRKKLGILEEEAQREPQWAATLRGLRESPEKLERKEAELTSAELLIVPSTFVKETLADRPEAMRRAIVIPYGAPAVAEAPARRLKHARLRVIYVGAVGQQKGISYLLSAVKALKAPIDLTIIGRPSSGLEQLPPGALAGCRWLPSLPHAAVLEEMTRHDVLVLPTLFDGFGLVILEAMSQGLPVITTLHSAGPDVIDSGINGFVIPIRSAEAIAEKLDLLAGDRALAAAMGDAARDKARLLSWQRYQAALLAAISAALGKEPRAR